MKARTLILSFLVLAAVAAAVVWLVDPLVPPPPAYGLRTNDPATLALGEKVYRQQCATCHGEKLEGQPAWRERNTQGLLPAPPHDATGHTWHHPDEVLFNLTKHGVAKTARLTGYASAMPAYAGTLSDTEIVAVLSWIKSSWPPQARAAQEEVNASHEKAAARRR